MARKKAITFTSPSIVENLFFYEKLENNPTYQGFGYYAYPQEKVHVVNV